MAKIDGPDVFTAAAVLEARRTGGGAAVASRSAAVAGDRVHGGGEGTKEGDAKEGADSYCNTQIVRAIEDTRKWIENRK